MEYLTKSEVETRKLGENIARKIKRGGVVFLFGDLGAGKTTFVKGVAAGLGLKKRILSPTFTIFRQYPLSEDQTFYHIDLYRVGAVSDLKSLGLEEVFDNSKNIILIEWPEKLTGYSADLTVTFDRLSETARKIDIN